jgi:hypothetical protein
VAVATGRFSVEELERTGAETVLEDASDIEELVRAVTA